MSEQDKSSNTTPAEARSVKIREARYILEILDFPPAQLNDRSALTLLALLNLEPETPWQMAEAPLLGTTPIMDWIKRAYQISYAPNTRETFRRQTLHQFIEAAIVVANPDQPDRPINSPKWVYQIESQALDLFKSFNTEQWQAKLSLYKAQHQGLKLSYAKQRNLQMLSVVVSPEQQISLTPGKHSELIKLIIEEFGSRYAPGGKLVYVGDTGEKWGYFDQPTLAQLNVSVDSHGKMPDVVIYLEARNWLLLVEAVTSHGPIDAKRYNELARLFGNSTAALVYITAFATRSQMAKYLSAIAWESEVWVAEAPDHLIHFDGLRFLGPTSNDK